MPYYHQPHDHRHHATTLGLFFFLFFLGRGPISAQAQDSPPPNNSFEGYSPSMATLLFVLIGFFFAMGFISVYIRHFSWCFRRHNGGDDGRRGPGAGMLRRRGLDPAAVEAFPTFVYSDVKVHRIGKGTLECAVCLNEFSDEEILRLLPGCSHVFHLHCIDPWLASHVTCPVCRANLEFHPRGGPTPTATLAHQLQFSEDELEPSDRDQRSDDRHDVIVSRGPSPEIIKTPGEGAGLKNEVGRIASLPRSHSTGHSLVVDCERFTLRLPEEVRSKLVNVGLTGFPALLSPRVGIRPDRWRFSVSPSFVSRSGSIWSPKSDGGNEGGVNHGSTGILSGPRSLLKSIKSPLNRKGAAGRTSDIGERSSDRLWDNRPSHDLESGGQ